MQNGFDALFTTAAQLIDELSAAFRDGRFAEAKRSMIFSTNEPLAAWEESFTTKTSLRPSSIGSSSGAVSSPSMDPRCEPDTSGLTTSASRRQITEGTTWPAERNRPLSHSKP